MSCLSITQKRFYTILAILLTITLSLSAPLGGVSVARAMEALIETYPGVFATPDAQVYSTQDAFSPVDLDLPPELTEALAIDEHPGSLTEAEGTSLPYEPFSISRIQSAYAVSELTAGTLVVTFTVMNNQMPVVTPDLSASADLTDTVNALQAIDWANDPNTIRNVLLTDRLADGVTYISAQPTPDQKAGNPGELAWNLGDLPPLKTITVTLTLLVSQLPSEITTLDDSAAAWGTLSDQALSARACPITLSPAEVGGETFAPYLRSTVDANFDDLYISKRAAQFCQPAATFEYVRSLGYEAYKGSLRGARGTQWSQAGNSLDKSNLLVAMLRGNGTPARYRHGTLDDLRARELILAMFPTTGGVVGYVPEGVEVSDPVNDPQLLAEASDHWWVEAYQNGSWVAMDPSFSYAVPGQTFAAPIDDPLAEIPADMRHTVTFTLRTERYDMLGYLLSGFVYVDTLVYTMTTAELVGEPVTLKHLVNPQSPPFGCLIFCWTHYTYAPYLRVGERSQVILGHQYWELLSDYPLGQFAVTAEWLIMNLRDPDGNVRTYTRTIADRVGIAQRESEYRIRGLIPELMTADVIRRFGPRTPSLVNPWDDHTIHFNPSWISTEYAAHAGENVLANAPRVLGAQPIISGLGDLDRVMQGGQLDIGGRLILAEVTDRVEDSNQAFNRLMGATFVAFSDGASQDLAETGLVKVYPDSPRITITSLVISPTHVVTEAVPVQSIDLLYDSLRVVAYPGQAKSAEKVYRLTRGMNEAFVEKMVGEKMIGLEGKSAAGVLLAATNQGIPLVYVDANNLDNLAEAQLSKQARARILLATKQGYGVLVPKRMVMFAGELTTAWWQINLETGETIGVGEEGLHQWLVKLIGFLWLLLAIIQIYRLLQILIARINVWRETAKLTWDYFWRDALGQVDPNGKTLQQIYQEALELTKQHMRQVWTAWEQDPWWSDWVPPEWVR
jgi:hypothetical protein